MLCVCTQSIFEDRITFVLVPVCYMCTQLVFLPLFSRRDKEKRTGFVFFLHYLSFRHTRQSLPLLVCSIYSNIILWVKHQNSTHFALRVMADFSKSRGFPFFIGKTLHVKHRKNYENRLLHPYKQLF